MNTSYDMLARAMQSLDETNKDALLRWMNERLAHAGIDDQGARRALLGDLVDLTEVPTPAPGTPCQRFDVQGGWLERNQEGEYWGRLELDPTVTLVFVMDQSGAAVSFSPVTPEFVQTGWE